MSSTTRSGRKRSTSSSALFLVEKPVSKSVKRILNQVAGRCRQDVAQPIRGTEFTCFYGQTSWVNDNKPTVQKLVNALLKTHQWITTHSPEEITAKMPEDYYAGDKDLYLTALR